MRCTSNLATEFGVIDVIARRARIVRRLRKWRGAVDGRGKVIDFRKLKSCVEATKTNQVLFLIPIYGRCTAPTKKNN